MAINSWDKGLREENEALKQQLMISAGEGGSPGQPYKPPVTNPGRGEAVYGTGKDGQRYFEFLKAMTINPANNIRKTNKPLGSNDNSYGEGEVGSGWKLSHQGQHYGPHGQPIEDPAKGMLPSGELIHMEHMEQSPEEHKRNKEMHIKNYGQQANMKDSLQRENVGGTLRDMMLPLLIKEYGPDGKGGYKNPGALLSGMKKLAQAPTNNIRSLQSSGHQTVLDDNRPGHLKIIKQFKPKA